MGSDIDNMDINTVLLVLRLVAEGVGVAGEIQKLVERVLNGETITDEEIQHARAEVRQAVSQFDNAVADRKKKGTN